MEAEAFEEGRGEATSDETEGDGRADAFDAGGVIIAAGEEGDEDEVFAGEGEGREDIGGAVDGNVVFGGARYGRIRLAWLGGGLGEGGKTHEAEAPAEEDWDWDDELPVSVTDAFRMI